MMKPTYFLTNKEYNTLEKVKTISSEDYNTLYDIYCTKYKRTPLHFIPRYIENIIMGYKTEFERFDNTIVKKFNDLKMMSILKQLNRKLYKRYITRHMIHDEVCLDDLVLKRYNKDFEFYLRFTGRTGFASFDIGETIVDIGGEGYDIEDFMDMIYEYKPSFMDIKYVNCMIKHTRKNKQFHLLFHGGIGRR